MRTFRHLAAVAALIAALLGAFAGPATADGHPTRASATASVPAATVDQMPPPAGLSPAQALLASWQPWNPCTGSAPYSGCWTSALDHCGYSSSTDTAHATGRMWNWSNTNHFLRLRFTHYYGATVRGHTYIESNPNNVVPFSSAGWVAAHGGRMSDTSNIISVGDIPSAYGCLITAGWYWG